MKTKFQCAITVVVLGMLCSVTVAAQSSEGDVSLGDLARTLRKAKAAPAKTVIDNDNLTQVMDDVESHRVGSGLLFSFDSVGKSFTVSSPDVTCSLSFNANATSLLSDPFTPRELPDTEIAKLDGPATVNGDTLQVSVYNGSSWNLQEITVGLTILRPADTKTAYYGPARLVTAAAGDNTPATDPVPAEKKSDLTVLYHIKGTAAPNTTTVFTETLGTTLAPNQDWHWAIVQAKGVPPAPPVAPTPAAPQQ
jgi:hypothetical protein